MINMTYIKKNLIKLQKRKTCHLVKFNMIMRVIASQATALYIYIYIYK